MEFVALKTLSESEARTQADRKAIFFEFTVTESEGKNFKKGDRIDIDVPGYTGQTQVIDVQHSWVDGIGNQFTLFTRSGFQ